AEAAEYPSEFFERRLWSIPRPRGDAQAMKRAGVIIRSAAQPLVIAGGGVIYSEASATLAKFVEQTGIPVAETQAGKGSLPHDHPQYLGAMGVTGTPGANIIGRDADLIIGVGTRYTDFTTASKTAFQNPAVKFININVDELDRGILECGFRSSREICIACADPDDQICIPADDIGSGGPGDSHRTEVLGVIVGQRSFSSLCLRYGNSCLLDKLGEGCGGL